MARRGDAPVFFNYLNICTKLFEYLYRRHTLMMAQDGETQLFEVMCLCVCVYTHIHVYMHIYVGVCARACVCVCVWVCTHTHEHTLTHTHTHTHTQVKLEAVKVAALRMFLVNQKTKIKYEKSAVGGCIQPRSHFPV